MEPIGNNVNKRPWLGWLLFLLTLGAGVGLGLLLTSVATHKAESRFAYTTPANIGEHEPRNEIWGKSYPSEFETYYQTQDTSFRSKYNGNKPIDMLEVDPRLVVLWAGYAFSKDYSQGRGHYYAIEDIRNTLRTGTPKDSAAGPQPGTCWTCKSPDVPRLMAKVGVAEFYKGKWAAFGHEVVNPIGCADCHDPKTMSLHISRPALVEAYQRQGKDITKATHQEMRSLVCAQCHVEYYFKGKEEKYLTFPWDNGLTVEAMEKYYDDSAVKHVDWVHTISKAPMLKAQHPDFEVYSMGIHAERGVSCADCHMPYKTEGGQKFTDHHIQSPLNNVANSCQVCHRESAETLKKNVYDRQDKVIEIRDSLEILLVRAHVEAGKAWELGADSTTMKPVLQQIRKAQWRWDYVAAGHGSAFHAPVEMGRVIGAGIVQAQEARIQLARILASKGFTDTVAYPDISSKAKAQEFIKLPMDSLRSQKKAWIETVVPKWLERARERESKL